MDQQKKLPIKWKSQVYLFFQKKIIIYKKTGIPNLTNNPPYFQNIPFENKKNMRNPSPHTNYDEKAYSEPHNLDNKSHLNFKSEKNEHNLEYIIIASKQYQDISKLYERSVFFKIL